MKRNDVPTRASRSNKSVNTSYSAEVSREIQERLYPTAIKHLRPKLQISLYSQNSAELRKRFLTIESAPLLRLAQVAESERIESTDAVAGGLQ